MTCYVHSRRTGATWDKQCSVDVESQCLRTQAIQLVTVIALVPMLCVLFRTGATWDKQHGMDVERQRLLAQTRDLVNKGLQADHLWHTATHADYARPMLQVQSQSGCTVLTIDKNAKGHRLTCILSRFNKPARSRLARTELAGDT